SSGAGVTADIKTIAAHDCYGVSAITALTVQSGLGVRRVEPVDPEFLIDSLEELMRDVKLSAVHVGMLGSAGAAEAVAGFLERSSPRNVVLDPVVRSSSGASLVDPQGVDILTERIMPLADVVTPNVDEAGLLTGQAVGNLEQMKVACERLREMGANAVVITGGHLDCAMDVLASQTGIETFRSDRLESSNTHGTGCAFSTAVACQLALGRTLEMAVLLAKAYVLLAIRNSYPIGRGTGPLNHFYGRVCREAASKS
ncbi:MAG: bifunctional hydroxymethylpyrimidine kinase/phosphomethylpyrimidine kinase, partial [Acidobacteria bacterium]|nr:bifunctional hydroxymethylpyrimidine kinase/phosphomethylpyrimidine kinase [Acidobacteriota bacterium]